ncbi:phospholipase B domain containing [Perkinsus olseni]|uniref:Phospholipase B domain containing n=1 Tax=Perkinsus olseni TaxID=32597 RepID=A0A7J6U9X9_PEROL|nr:phospholipase B domain containing [Perkinsus olseni]
MLSLLFFAHCLLIQLSTGYDDVKPFETHSISVYVPGAMSNGNSAQLGVHYKKGVQDDSAAAKGYFEDSLLSRGWGVLEICKSPDSRQGGCHLCDPLAAR